MPLGKSLWDHLQGGSLEEIVDAVATIATTLSELELTGVFHRDVKPENMLWLEDEAYIGDFGLVDYPEKQEVQSKSVEMNGRRWHLLG